MMFRKKSAGNALKRSSLRIPAALVVFAFLSAAPQLASADTIVSSLSNNTQTVTFPAGQWAASPFTTGIQSWKLTNVALSLLQGGVNSSLADVRLYSDNAGQPGVSLADLGVQTITFQSQLWSFVPASDIELASGTTYWIAVGNVSTDAGLTVSLVPSAPFSFTGSLGASMAFIGTDGTGSGLNPPVAFDQPGEGALPYQAEGTSTSVPEPGPCAVLFLGGVTVLASRRLRRASAA